MIGNRLPVRRVCHRLAETWVMGSVRRDFPTRRHRDQRTASRLLSRAKMVGGSVCPASTCLVPNGLGWVASNRSERGTALAVLRGMPLPRAAI